MCPGLPSALRIQPPFEGSKDASDAGFGRNDTAPTPHPRPRARPATRTSGQKKKSPWIFVNFAIFARRPRSHRRHSERGPPRNRTDPTRCLSVRASLQGLPDGRRHFPPPHNPHKALYQGRADQSTLNAVTLLAEPTRPFGCPKLEASLLLASKPQGFADSVRCAHIWSGSAGGWSLSLGRC